MNFISYQDASLEKFLQKDMYSKSSGDRLISWVSLDDAVATNEPTNLRSSAQCKLVSLSHQVQCQLAGTHLLPETQEPRFLPPHDSVLSMLSFQGCWVRGMEKAL